MAFDPYEILGVARDADLGTIRASYRVLAKIAHPDKGGDREKWDRLRRAHEILTDPDRRARYDATGSIEQIDPVTDRQQAYGLIALKFAEFADQFVRADFHPTRDPRTQPVLEQIRRHISGELRDAEKALKVGQRQLEFLGDYAGRLTRRKDAAGIDQIAAIMREKIGQIEQRIVQVELVIRVRVIAIDVLDEYSFEQQEALAPSGYGVGTASTATIDLSQPFVRME